jgi:signal peptide peptidase SppA
MPYKGHACRLQDPDKFDESRLAENEREHEGKKYHVLYGRRKSDGEWEDQSYRYPSETWSEAEARSHCGEHDGEFHPAGEADEAQMRQLDFGTKLPVDFAAHLVESPWAISPAAFSGLCVRGSDQKRKPKELVIHFLDANAAASAKLDLPRSEGTVAVIPIHGVIERTRTYWGDVFAEEIGAAIATLVDRDDIGAIVLDVDSPGGVVFGIPELGEQIRAARKAKPIYAVTGSQMASAAYWIGSAASKLFAAPSAQVGSIGVWSAHVDVSKLLDEIGIKVTLISAGKYKVEGHMFAPLEEEASAAMQERVNHYYDEFVAAVARNRGLRETRVRNGFGEGRELVAPDALDEGMIDGIATLGDLVAAIVPKRRGSRQASALADLAIEEAE